MTSFQNKTQDELIFRKYFPLLFIFVFVPGLYKPAQFLTRKPLRSQTPLGLSSFERKYAREMRPFHGTHLVPL